MQQDGAAESVVSPGAAGAASASLVDTLVPLALGWIFLFVILVVANFPANFTEEAARRLVSIATSGARCGVYTLITVDSRQPLPPMAVTQASEASARANLSPAEMQARTIQRFGTFEEVLLEDVIPLVDASYRTIPNRENRAIAGFSMGGGEVARGGADDGAGWPSGATWLATIVSMFASTAAGQTPNG